MGQRDRRVKTGISFIDAEDIGLGQVIEISGSNSTGKSTFLMQLAAKVCLPEESGGLNGHVAYFDHDHRLSASRFNAILTHHSKDVKNRLKIYHCSTDFEILATLLQYHRSFQPLEALVILIDSIDTFCVHDKLLAEQTTQGLTLQHQFFQLIQRLVKDHNALVIGTRSPDSVVPAIWTTQVNKRIILTRTKEEKFHVLSNDQRPEYRVTERGIEEA